MNKVRPFDHAWSVLKGLPRQQMFVPQRVRTNLAWEDAPNQGVGTVHPAISNIITRNPDTSTLREGIFDDNRMRPHSPVRPDLRVAGEHLPFIQNVPASVEEGPSRRETLEHLDNGENERPLGMSLDEPTGYPARSYFNNVPELTHQADLANQEALASEANPFPPSPPQAPAWDPVEMARVQAENDAVREDWKQ